MNWWAAEESHLRLGRNVVTKAVLCIYTTAYELSEGSSTGLS